MIIGYITDELTYDAMHPNANQTYKIGVHRIFEDGNETHYGSAPALWSDQMKAKYPEVKEVLRTMWFGYPASVTYEKIDKILLTEELFFVEDTYSDVLYMRTVLGERNHPLKETNSIAINETTAKKIFGDENPIGKILVLKHPFATSDNELSLEVKAVFEDYPSNTHFKPSYLVNIESLRSVIEWGNYDDFFTGWLDGFMSTYIVLEQGADYEAIESNLKSMVAENLEDQAAFFIPFLRSVRDLHFDTELEWTAEGSGDITYVYIFGSIAFLLIIIACINYMNLATARSAKRSKEVGLRKVMGSNRGQLFLQFINESFITTLLSIILSFLLVSLALPFFNTIAQKEFTILSFMNISTFIGLFVIALFVSFVAGSYPALYLSKFRPAQVLKGGKVSKTGSNSLRRTLVLLQFSISFFMVICTGVLLKQINFLQSSKLNEAGSQTISIRYGGTAPSEKYSVYKNLVIQQPGIEMVTMANHLPRQNYFGGIGVTIKVPEVSDQEYNWSELNVDFNFPKAFNLEILAGRGFDENNPSDSSTCLINESALENLGIDISSALGLTIEDPESQQNMVIIGVVKDFPYRSMHQSIGPLRISARPHPVDKIVYAKVPSKDINNYIEVLEAKWKEVFPGIGFDYWFLDEEFGRMYESETRMADLTQAFSIVAILIACLGIFGLASFMAEQRTKEVGIRKVLGASVQQILVLFLKIFAKMLIISAIIGGPIAYILMNQWLQEFVYHVSIDWKIITGAIVLVFGLTIITVIYEIMKVSITNPVKSIRYE